VECLIAPLLGERSGDLARALIASHGSLAAVLNADETLLGEELDGDARAAALLAAVREVHLSLLREPIRDREIVGNYADLIAYLHADLAHKRTEQVRILFLSSANRLLRDEIVSEGCLDEAPLYVRDILRRALQVGAGAIIVVHNHHSGDATPSKADIDITRQLIEAGRTLGVLVHDHLVVGGSGVVSMRNLGLI
jgi:DNA repair protein RadC